MDHLSQDHYRVLGVPRTADEAAVRRAYRERARRVHPDVDRSPEATERMQRLVLARDTLLHRRAEYDAQLARSEPRPGTPARLWVQLEELRRVRPPTAPGRTAGTTGVLRAEQWQFRARLVGEPTPAVTS